MDGQQLWVAEEELLANNPPTPTSFVDLDDDAFDDDDDNDLDYEFSLTTIRAELARAVSSHEIPTNIEKPLDAETAGETSEHAEISGSLLVRMTANHSTSTSPHCRHVLDSDGSQLYAKFDTVSLSESPMDEKQKPAHDDGHHDTLNEVEATNDDCGLTPTEDDSVAHHGTPESRPPSIEANLDSPPLSPPPSGSQLDTSTSGDDPETPPEQPISAKVASTPSLDIPPVSSPTTSSPSRPSSSHQVHKVTRSSGPSILEKVLSKTRPSFLPPKDRDEDRRHLSDWEKMMKRSRAAGAQ